MSAVVLRRIEPEKNMARFYRMDVQPDLFDGWSFIRESGRIGRPGTRPKASNIKVYPDTT